jgi:hypothetical protein
VAAKPAGSTGTRRRRIADLADSSMSPVKYFGLSAVVLLQDCLQTAPTVNTKVLAAPEFAEVLKFKV